MSTFSFRSSKPHDWIVPRPHTDAHQRMLTYGPIQSMEAPTLLERILFGRR